MARHYLELMSTPTVLTAQEKYLGRAQRPLPPSGTDHLTESETEFIAARDSFYLSTVTETGWPYVQHRGGPAGFLHVVAPNQLAFADYRGNRQLLSTGNLTANDRVALFLVDYPERTRLKILGHAEVLDAREHPDLVQRLATPATVAKVERIFQIRVVAYDWNCPQYITPRYTVPEIEKAVAPLRQRIAELEAELRSNRT